MTGRQTTTKAGTSRILAMALILAASSGGAILSGGLALAADGAAPERAAMRVDPVGDGPHYFDTAMGADIRVRVIARGIDHPWGIAWLPDGSALVTEKNTGAILRIVNDQLLEEAVGRAPSDASVSRFTGLLDIVTHPDFASQPWVYISYNKVLPDDEGAIAVARGRWDGSRIVGIEDIFVGEVSTNNGVRLLFGADGMLYVGVYVTSDNPEMHFHTATQKGKILRLTPEGGIPDDNPFVGNDDYLPEIYSYGHRTPTGMALHPQSGEIWSTEMGPNGGDELNRIRAGGNYGWPLVSLGRAYAGGWQADSFQLEGTIDPVSFWMPAISPSSLSFYDGEEFPEWQGDLFVGAMQKGQIAGTGQLLRLKLNADGDVVHQESLLTELRQRIRGVKQGPDGRLYLLTDEDDGLVLRIERADD